MGGRCYSGLSPSPNPNLDQYSLAAELVALVQLPVELSVGLVRLSVGLPVGLPVELPVGLVRLCALGYPPDPPVGDFGGCTPPGPEIVGVAGRPIADQAEAPTVDPTVDPRDRIDRLDHPVAQKAPAAG